MIKLPFKIVPNPKLKKRERKLPLEHFFTFANGESIFTFRPTDLGLISGRYIDKVKQDISFLMEYGASKTQVEIYETKAVELINAGLNGTKPQGEVLAELKAQFDERKTLYKYNADLNERLWFDLYTMFFVLESEDELLWTPAANQRKLELLMTCTEDQREFFFATLADIMIYYSDSFKADILESIQMKASELEVLDFLTGRINKPNSK